LKIRWDHRGLLRSHAWREYVVTGDERHHAVAIHTSGERCFRVAETLYATVSATTASGGLKMSGNRLRSPKAASALEPSGGLVEDWGHSHVPEMVSRWVARGVPLPQRRQEIGKFFAFHVRFPLANAFL
jgi:hypothetical protein